MGFVKRTWLGRIGTGLNKFIIGARDSGGKQTLVNSPDSVSQEGDVISAANLNDLEDRIEDGLDDVQAEIQTEINGLKMTQIWENPNPTASMAQQTIEIEGLAGADYVMVAYRTPYGDVKYELTAALNGSTCALNYCHADSEYIEIITRFIFFYTIGATPQMNVRNCFGGYISSSGSVSYHTENNFNVPVAVYKVGDIFS